jgi:hypothetical protein
MNNLGSWGASGGNMQFSIDDTVRLHVGNNGNIGVGTDTPDCVFSVTDGNNTISSNFLSGTLPLTFISGQAQNVVAGIGAATAIATQGATLQFRRSRGTLASPAAVVEDDMLGSLFSAGYGGSSQIFSAAIQFFVDGSVTTSVVPQRVSIVTGTTAGNRAERLVVKSNGDIMLNDVSNGEGDFLTRSGAGVVTRRTTDQTKSDLGKVTWIFLISQRSSPPVSLGAATSPVAGEIFEYTYDGVTRYRLVPSTYTEANDAFYENRSGTTLSNLITSRST